MGKFVIRRVPTGVKFDLKAANGEVIASSEVYTSDAACATGIESVRKNAPKAGLEDQTKRKQAEKVKNPKFEIFRDAAGLFRFRLRAKNGETIAVSDAYKAKASCINGIESVRRNASSPVVVAD